MAEPPETDAFEALLAFLRDSRGFDFTGYKRSSLQRRVGKRLQEVGVEDYERYVDYLEVHPDEFEKLFDYILINVTGFFRDADIWDFLREQIVPRIVDDRPEGPIRAWCAGVASGEEAYSVAMILASVMGSEAYKERVKVYGTDLDEEALARARAATYSAKEVEPVPPDLLHEYFDPANAGGWSFNRDLRRSVIFGRHDLVQDAPISKVDLLLCRNTLMYFNAETQSRVMAHFQFGLRSGGYMVLGKAEMLFTHLRSFAAVDLKRRVFTKLEPDDVSRERLVSVAQDGHVEGSGAIANHARSREAALEANPTPQIVVSRSGFMVFANERARELFRIDRSDVGRPLQDLPISYRPIELRSRIEAALDERRTQSASGVSWTGASGEPMVLDVEVRPLVDDGSRVLGAAVLFTDITRYQELQTELEESNQELETALEELQSTNEELETTNEELQSTNEELETTNEELQSTNEELETMNEELQSTNEELSTINYQLRQRSTEVDELNNFLSEILGNVDASVIVLDRDLLVRVWNRRSEDLWGLRRDEVIGHPLLGLDIGLPVAELRPVLRSTLDGEVGSTIDLGAINRRGRSIQTHVRASPLGSLDGAVDGVILLVEELAEEQAPS